MKCGVHVEYNLFYKFKKTFNSIVMSILILKSACINHSVCLVEHYWNSTFKSIFLDGSFQL